MLSGIKLTSLDRGSLESASRLAPLVVRSLDAIHLEAAVVLKREGTIDAVLTFDRQLRAGCEHHSLAVEPTHV